MKGNLYIDAEWYPNQHVFLLGYAYDNAVPLQLYGRRLKKSTVVKLLDSATGYIFFYGPDIALLENHFDMDIRHNYRCVNLLPVARLCMPYAKSWRLAHLEKVFHLPRHVSKYKQSIHQIYNDWNDPVYRRRVLLYNLDDVRNLVLVKRKLFERHVITADYLNSILLK